MAFTGLPMIFYFAGIGDVPKGDVRRGADRGGGASSIDAKSCACRQLRPVTAVVVMLTLF